jgi:hypothetical protein
MFHREAWSPIATHLRQDEIHRVDILESLLRSKRYHIMNFLCMDTGENLFRGNLFPKYAFLVRGYG